ncbi:hypothetical protein BNJ_00411 [Kaumoebavirus]|uniref:hypothetical protein n=1 Tax=Kaumoebavirus TaxID=1859492 RepID=UPI0009C229BC|nr:hypothetical protein BNJ_00411 [Kaumoebavirus]ARA72228.1 hypothetical protein BNJ_00411 [Kaumoebavirus]
MDYRNYYISYFEFHGMEVDDDFLGTIDKFAADFNWTAKDIKEMKKMEDLEEVRNFFFYAFGAKQVTEKLGWKVPDSMKWWSEIELPLRERALRSNYTHFVHNIMQFQPKP